MAFPPPATLAPALSVVVLASRHPEFVFDALASVGAQTLEPSQRELIVVRDYEDPELARRTEALGGRSVAVPPGDIGPAIRAGVDAARGRVLVFLDDDDRYRPERLATVARVFQQDPDLGFYRNGFDVIDAEGHTVPDHPFRSAERELGRRLGPVTLTAGQRASGWAHWPPVGFDFNSSCMAIRRDVLNQFIDQQDLTGFRLLDALMFVAALAAPVAIRFDPTPWTEYRIHGRNASHNPQQREDPLMGRADFSRRVAPSYDRLVQLAQRSGSRLAIHEAEGLATVQRSYLALRDPATPRTEFARLRRALARQRSSYLVRSERQLPAALRLFSIAPRLGRWMYGRRARAGGG
jgi:hypothetical protein